MTADATPHLAAVADYLATARWFGGKGRDMQVRDVRRVATLTEAPGSWPRVVVELVRVEYAASADAAPGEDAEVEVYQVPVSYYLEPEDRLEHALVGTWEDPEHGSVLAYDAVHDRAATSLWLAAFEEGRRIPGPEGELVFHRLEGHDLDATARGTLFSGEQSNSSIAFGEDSLMKLFRKVTAGSNPDIEIHDALTRAESPHVAALYGWLEVVGEDAGPDGPEPVQLAMLQQFLRTASDGWGLALASVRDLYAEADLHADEVGGDFAGESERLGIATAEIHDALAQQFPTTTWRVPELAVLADQMRGRLDAALSVVPDLEEHRTSLRATFDLLAEVDQAVAVQRVHGDFHLGQTLRTTKGWKIVDFEGEPAKPLATRTRPDSPWRDVAGMMRSFDYAAHAVESDADLDEGQRAQIAYRAAEWATRNQQAFLRGYASVSDRTGDGTVSAQQRLLLRTYEVDKAVYEAVYEARNRPAWLGIPLAAIARLAQPEETRTV